GDDVFATWLGRDRAAGHARDARWERRIDRRLGSGRDRVRWRDRIVALRLVYDDGVAVESLVGEELRRLPEVDDREEQLAVVLFDARAAADDLFELGHRRDVLIEHDDLAGARVDARREELRRG